MGTLRIGIDAGSVLSGGGVGRYTSQLLQALVELKEDVQFVCYVQPGSLRGASPPGWEPHPQIEWIQTSTWLLRWRAAHDRLDLFHGPNFKMRAEGRHGGTVTIHDLWLDRYPQYSTKLFGQRLACQRTRRTAWRARRVIAVSQHTARDIQAVLELLASRIAVIPNGVSGAFYPDTDSNAMQALRRRLSLTGPFILFVGGADPRKNHEVLLRACAGRPALLQNRMLVLVGDVEHRFGSFEKTADRLGLRSKVCFPGWLASDDLRLLYSHADVFVYPSIYEGFGMPVLEAMACGVPVVTSNSTSLPEVAGDAALLVDPHDPTELAEALGRVLEQPCVRDTLVQKGFARAKQFPWSRAARSTMDLFKELCADTPSTG